MFTTRRSSFVFSNVTKKVTQARKGLGTNSVGLATELSLVSKLLQKVIPKKISANGNRSKHNSSEVIFHRFGQICNLLSAFNCILCFQDIEKNLGDICSISIELTRN